MEWWWPAFEQRDWKKYLRERSTYNRRTGCWEWNLYVSTRGYPVVWLKIKGRKKGLLVHRVAYMAFVGPIPDGLQIDHTCFNRLCWRPSHLEAVTCLVNNQRAWEKHRKERCPQGHKFTSENTRIRRGRRECKQCVRDRVDRWQAQHPEKVREYKRRSQERHREKVTS